MASLSTAIGQFIDQIHEFQSVCKSTRGKPLPDDDYYRWTVPLSQRWEVIYAAAQNAERTDLEKVISGQESEAARGLQLLRLIAEKWWPMPLIAGEVTQVVLPRVDEGTLEHALSQMLPSLEVAQRLISNGVEPDGEALECYSPFCNAIANGPETDPKRTRGRKEGNNRHAWTADCERMKREWFRKCGEREKRVPRITFIRRELKENGSRYPDGDTAETMDKRFQTNPEKWKSALAKLLKSGPETDRT